MESSDDIKLQLVDQKFEFRFRFIQNLKQNPNFFDNELLFIEFGNQLKDECLEIDLDIQLDQMENQDNRMRNFIKVFQNFDENSKIKKVNMRIFIEKENKEGQMMMILKETLQNLKKLRNLDQFKLNFLFKSKNNNIDGLSQQIIDQITQILEVNVQSLTNLKLVFNGLEFKNLNLRIMEQRISVLKQIEILDLGYHSQDQIDQGENEFEELQKLVENKENLQNIRLRGLRFNYDEQQVEKLLKIISEKKIINSLRICANSKYTWKWSSESIRIFGQILANSSSTLKIIEVQIADAEDPQQEELDQTLKECFKIEQALNLDLLTFFYPRNRRYIIKNFFESIKINSVQELNVYQSDIQTLQVIAQQITNNNISNINKIYFQIITKQTDFENFNFYEESLFKIYQNTKKNEFQFIKNNYPKILESPPNKEIIKAQFTDNNQNPRLKILSTLQEVKKTFYHSWRNNN